MRFIIKKQSSWLKTFFCRHEYDRELGEFQVSKAKNDKFVIQYDTCVKCGLQWQETLERPSPRIIKLSRKVES